MEYKSYKISPGENITDYDLICYHCKNFKEYKDSKWAGHFECERELEMADAMEAGYCEGIDDEGE